MIRLTPTSTQPSLLAFGAVALIALLAGMAIGSRATTSSVTGTPAPTGSASSTASTTSASTTPAPTTIPSPAPTPSRTPSMCTLPPQLAAAEAPAGAPTVSGDVAMVFASPLYSQTPGGVTVRDQLDFQWAMGLWYVAAGTNEARLLLSPAGGMVLPLAFSPAGDRAAIWWMPERRGVGEPPCEGGIYVLSTATGRTDLVSTGDWSFDPGDKSGSRLSDWLDPDTGPGAPRGYDLPEVSFSSDGQSLAIADGDEIAIYSPGQAAAWARHTGDCTEWAWAPVRSTFVAGCERMTTAWWVDLEDDVEEGSVALPRPSFVAEWPGWEAAPGQGIGLTRDGRIRVVRFYGFPTGCEDPDCILPPPGYAVTTVDLATGAATHRSRELNAIVAFEDDDSTWLNADASWVYAVLADQRGGAVARIESGPLPPLDRLGSFTLGPIVGASADGSTLYGWRTDESVVVAALDASGSARDVAMIDWPDGVITESPVIRTFGLAVAAPN